MKKFQKVISGLAFSLIVATPALADYSQVDLIGTLDNSISVRILDSASTQVAGNNNTTVPTIDFGSVNIAGIQNGVAGTGVGGVPVNVFLGLDSAGTFYNAATNAPPNGIAGGAGLFGIKNAGGTIKIEVISSASSSSNLAASYITQTGSPPDVILADATTTNWVAGSSITASTNSIIPAGMANQALRGTGGSLSTIKVSNTTPLSLNIGVVPNAGLTTQGAWKGRLKFTATP